MTKREQFVTEAQSWIGTPYIIRGRVKGAGCDCGSLPMSAAVNCGLMDQQDLEIYSVDCWQHWSDEKYLIQVMRHTNKLMERVAYKDTPILPGCLVMTRTIHSKVYNHCGIVTKWPRLVHAVVPKVEEVDSTKNWLWAYRPIIVFDFKRMTE
jgi:cell wall-associated NlpC family hydrolase